MIAGDDFDILKTRVLFRLSEQLSDKLTYHNVEHTKDVLEQAEIIARAEGIAEADLHLLKIAALYHDTGFFHVYRGHEAESCKLVKKDLEEALTEQSLETVCGMIMATKIPQSPATHIEKIICDADLDYLGRADFEPISDALRREFLHYKIAADDREWQQMQIRFFETHHYFTTTSNERRNSLKQKHLQDLKIAFSLQYGQ